MNKSKAKTKNRAKARLNLGEMRNRAQIAEYLPQFKKFGDSPLSTFQEPELQHLRFEKLMASILEVNPKSFSLHDVGCGPGHLHEYLNKARIAHNYSGSEIVDEIVENVTRKYPAIEVLRRDFTCRSPSEKYDFVVCNGVLHFPAGVPLRQWKKFAYTLIKSMFESATKGIAFNFLTTYKTTHNAALCYLDPLDVFDFCQKNMSRFVVLDHAYPLYEATITVFNKDYMGALYSGDVFKKYFRS